MTEDFSADAMGEEWEKWEPFQIPDTLHTALHRQLELLTSLPRPTHTTLTLKIHAGQTL